MTSPNHDQPHLQSIPVTIKQAQRFVRACHRHLPNVPGGLFAVGVARRGESATDGTANACSKLYSLCRRVAQTLGYRRIYTYTREEELGTSLLAAGCEPAGQSKGGSWQRRSRLRNSVNTGRKARWRV